jgi:hypothetical protein
MAPMSRSWHLYVHGKQTDSARSRRLDGEHLWRWCFSLARRFSSLGARIGPLSAVRRIKLQVAHIKLSHSRAFLLRARDLAQSTSLTSGDQVVWFTMLAPIGTRMSRPLLKVVPGLRKNAAPARHLSRVFPQHREVFAKIVAQSEELDENLQVRFNGETSPKYGTGVTSAKEVS